VSVFKKIIEVRGLEKVMNTTSRLLKKGKGEIMQSIRKKKISKGVWHSMRFSLFALMSIIMLSFALPALAGAVSVTVNPLTTNDDTPTLTGTVTTDAINVNIRIGTENHNAAISGSTWSFGWPTSLSDGTYDVHATAMDAGYNFGYDSTTNELVIDTTAPVITVPDAGPLGHEYGTAFTDPGATATDAVDGVVSLTSSTTIDVNTLGAQILTYDYTDVAGNMADQVTVTVNVVDTTAPVITVPDVGPLSHEYGTAFTDPGATATDA